MLRQSYRSFWGLFSKSFTRILPSILTTLDTNIKADASRRPVFAATEVRVAARRGFFELACQRHVRPHPILHHVPIDGGMFFFSLSFPNSGQDAYFAAKLFGWVGGVVSITGIHSLKSQAGRKWIEKSKKNPSKNVMIPSVTTSAPPFPPLPSLLIPMIMAARR